MPPTNSAGAVERSWNFRRDPVVVQAKERRLELEAAHSDRCAGTEIFLLGWAIDPALGIKQGMHLGPSAAAGAGENPQAKKDRGSANPVIQASPNSRQNDAKETPMKCRTHCRSISRSSEPWRAISKMLSDVFWDNSRSGLYITPSVRASRRAWERLKISAMLSWACRSALRAPGRPMIISAGCRSRSGIGVKVRL
jgi:hypothetical protein